MKSQIHLTHQQFCDLLIADPEEAGHEIDRLSEHLRECPACADEFAALCQPIENFRSATTAWANHNSIRRSGTSSAGSNTVSHLTGWVLATATLAVAIIVPIAIHEHNSASRLVRNAATATSNRTNYPSTTIGDEALLEEIDQTVSSSIPSPMEPLADPTAGRSNKTDSRSRKN